MVPEETSKPGAESPDTPGSTETAAPHGRRSSRRRGHRGRGRRPQPTPSQLEPAPAPSVEPAPPPPPPVELTPQEDAVPALEPQPETAPSLPPEVEADLGAPAPAITVAETAPLERPARAPAPHHRPLQPAPRMTIQQLIDDVNDIIGALRKTSDEMEEVLEALEVIERQGGADEREIESLRRALRQMQRPRDGGGPHHRGR